MINDLSTYRSAVDSYMRALRDVTHQNNRELFRLNVRRIGRIIAYEVSKRLDYERSSIQTPLAKHNQYDFVTQPVVITILRAGLPLHEGILDVFPAAENGFISAYRKHKESGFSIEVEYVACPSLDGKVLILNDPMLATGQSFITALSALKPYGTPKKIVLASVIASEAGVMYLKEHLDIDFELWVGAIDPELNDEKYIVPGLGDAGDLSFGHKLQN